MDVFVFKSPHFVLSVCITYVFLFSFSCLIEIFIMSLFPPAGLKNVNAILQWYTRTSIYIATSQSLQLANNLPSFLVLQASQNTNSIYVPFNLRVVFVFTLFRKLFSSHYYYCFIQPMFTSIDSDICYFSGPSFLPTPPSFHPDNFSAAQNMPFRISFSACLLLMNSFSFCLSETIFILPSLMEGSLPEHRIWW